MATYNITGGVRFDEAQKAVIYGPEGIGKSTFASMFPNPIFIDTEGGTGKIDVQRLDRPTSWSMLLDEVRFIRNNPTLCDTLVIDTADWAEKLCREEICATAHKTSIEDFGYGKGYTYLMESFGKLLNLLEELKDRGINSVIVAHSCIRKFEQPDELGAYDRYEMKLEKKVAALVKEWSDLMLFLNYKTVTVKTDDKKTKAVSGGTRVMYTTHHSCWDAKNRFGLPDELTMDYGHIAPFIPCRLHAAPVVQKDTPEMVPTIPPKTAPMPAEDFSPVPDETAEVIKMDLTGIPRGLADLMRANNVTPEEIELVVAMKGYYPSNTPITNYDPNFVDGVLIGAWDQVLSAIKSDVRSVPF